MRVAKEVMSENLEKEINATSISGVKQVSFMSKLLWPLTCAIDFAWQQWSCGVAYNSLSGHCFLMGARTQKILDTVIFSKSCRFCTNAWKKQGIDPKNLNEPMGEISPKPHHRCPRNFKGSSKSMEPIAAVKMIVRLFETGIAYVSKLLGDNDSTTRAQVQHSHQAKIDAGIMKDSEWPVNKKGKCVADHGKLPLHVKAVDKFLADPSHHCKSWGRALYGLYRKIGKSIGMSKVECECLK